MMTNLLNYSTLSSVKRMILEKGFGSISLMLDFGDKGCQKKRRAKVEN